jgi:hypothetical protein
MRKFENEWNTNESLLQSYRSIFLSSQSFLLAVGAILIDKENTTLLYIVGIMALFQIWFIWFRVVYTRLLIVDYYKYGGLLNNKEIDNLGGNREYLQADDKYVSDLEYRKKVNSIFVNSGSNFTSNLRTTRIKIDIIIPVIFTLIWIGFLLNG